MLELLKRELEKPELVRLAPPNRELEKAALLKPRFDAKLELPDLEELSPERPSTPESARLVETADDEREEYAPLAGARVVADIDPEFVGARPAEVLADPRVPFAAGAPEFRATVPFVPRAAGAAELLRAVVEPPPERPK